MPVPLSAPGVSRTPDLQVRSLKLYAMVDLLGPLAVHIAAAPRPRAISGMAATMDNREPTDTPVAPR
jgi:hypothetical protein